MFYNQNAIDKFPIMIVEMNDNNLEKCSVEEKNVIAKEYCYAALEFYRNTLQKYFCMTVILIICTIAGIAIAEYLESKIFTNCAIACLIMILVKYIYVYYQFVYKYEIPYCHDAQEFLENHGITREISHIYWLDAMYRMERFKFLNLGNLFRTEYYNDAQSRANGYYTTSK